MSNFFLKKWESFPQIKIKWEHNIDTEKERSCCGWIGVKALGLHSALPSLFFFPWNVSRTQRSLKKVVLCISQPKHHCQLYFSRIYFVLSPFICSTLCNFFSVWLGSQRSALVKGVVQVALLRKQAGAGRQEASLGFFSWHWHWFMMLSKARCGTHMPPFLCYEKTPGAFCRVLLC